MSIRRLEYFLATAGSLSYHTAADRWGISLGSVRNQIAILERELGVALFVRQDQTLTGLTRAGILYRIECAKLVERHHEAVQRGIHLAEGREGILRLGICEDAATRTITTVLNTCLSRHKDIRFDIVERSSGQLASALRRHELDFAFLIDCVDARSLVLEPLWSNPWIVVLPVGHPLAALDALTCEDLRDSDLVMAHEREDSHGHAQIRAAFRRSGITPRVAAHALGRSTMLFLSRVGVGVTFVPRTFFSAAMPAAIDRIGLVFRPLEIEPVTICGGYRAYDPPGIAMRFLRLTQEILRTHPDSPGVIS